MAKDKVLKLDVDGFYNHFQISVDISCDELIDHYTYHDAPSSLYYYMTLEDLQALQEDVENALAKVKQLEQLNKDVAAIVEQGDAYMISWLKERGWKIHKELKTKHSIWPDVYICTKKGTNMYWSGDPLHNAIYAELLVQLEKEQEAGNGN